MGSEVTRKTPYPVMLSSTYKELAEHREAVRKAMLGQRLMPVAMEDDAVLPDKDLISASLSKVEESDAYVGLISYRYGQAPYDPNRNPDELSLTELEFRRAVERKIPICMFIMHDDHPVPRSAVGEERGVEEKYDTFVKLAKKGRIYAEFTSVDDLKAKAVQSLVELRYVLERSLTQLKASWPSSRYAISNIPIRVPRHFIGRDADLTAIEDALRMNNGRTAITALHGLRGVGKTTLAVAYAEKRDASFRAIWWIRAETESTLRADLVDLGVGLGWVASDEKEEPALTSIIERLRYEGGGILLIYDNANNVGEIRPYLPRGGAVQIIVTSNAPDWHGIAAPVEIEVWPNEIGADYLMERTGRNNERDAALALSEALGGLPLAHEQAAAYCDRLGISLADYLERFETTPAKLLDAEKDASAEYHDRRTVARTFALAIDEAAKLHPAAEPLIVYTASLAPEPIPLYLFSEAREEFDEPFASAIAGDGLDEAVATLRAFALVDRDIVADVGNTSVKTDSVRLHRLVRQIAVEGRRKRVLDEARRSLVRALAAIYPTDVFSNPKSWQRARELDPIVLALVSRGSFLPEEAQIGASDLLIKLAGYRYSALGAYAEAQVLCERAVGICEKALGFEHPKTARGVHALALTLREQGDSEAAAPLLERALSIFEKTLDPDDPQIGASLNQLAIIRRNQGDFAAAESLFKRAIAIFEKALGPDHPDTAVCFNQLGWMLGDQGERAEARALHERALQINEKAFGPDHPATAASLAHLAFQLHADGDFVRAMSLYQRSLTIREKQLRPDHPETALTLNNIGALLRTQGDFAGALSYFERALAACEKVLGAKHSRTQASVGLTLDTLDALGRADEAKMLRDKYGMIKQD